MPAHKTLISQRARELFNRDGHYLGQSLDLEATERGAAQVFPVSDAIRDGFYRRAEMELSGHGAIPDRSEV